VDQSLSDIFFLPEVDVMVANVLFNLPPVVGKCLDKAGLVCFVDLVALSQ
jgi:hypothetical protein